MKGLLNSSKLFLKRNASTVLTCVGAGGVVVTSIMAVKATPKAIILLEEAKNEKNEDLTKTEIIKVAGPVYIPSIIVGASTIACVFGANVLNKHKQAALASAYALLNSSYNEYKDKVEELYGEGTNNKISDEITKDNYNKEKIQASNGEVLFYDEYSGRYFESTIEKVQQAEYYVNRDLNLRDYVYLNEYYDYLGIPQIKSGWTLGWSVGACFDMYWQNWIDFGHRTVTLDDGLECKIITMYQEPILDFENYN